MMGEVTEILCSALNTSSISNGEDLNTLPNKVQLNQYSLALSTDSTDNLELYTDKIEAKDIVSHNVSDI